MPADRRIERVLRWTLLLAAAAVIHLLSAPLAIAGGGPENVLLLVNSQSRSSKTIANHFIKIRHIPGRNVLYLDWSESVESIDVDTFRKKILQPAIAAIKQRRIGDQIDYLVYSSDFPWAVDVRGDFADVKLPKQLSTTASLNGLTYLWQFVLSKHRNMIGLRNNLYAKRHTPGTSGPRSSHNFRSWYGWDQQGEVLEAGGPNYLLSTMLGVTSGRGNSVKEVLHYLYRSAAADGTRPPGTIYFVKNGDVRSSTRDWAFEDAVAQLKLLGVKGEIIESNIPLFGAKLPDDRPDVMGAMIGTAAFDWADSGSTILPGAICEHLTSLGGILRKGAGQTALSEFLRHGAAGASGTVTEPYAIQDKFPLASVHVHYARGCSLAEAFYQSVSGPYQLLIVGDPLCQPWARIAQVDVDGIEHGQSLDGTVEFTPRAKIRGGNGVERFELYVDGQRWDGCPADGRLKLDTRQFPDGYHELRIVALESGPIQCQGRLIVPVQIANHGQTIALRTTGGLQVSRTGSVHLEVKSTGAAGFVIFQNGVHGRQLATIAGEQGEAQISAETLGQGPVVLQAAALGTRQAFSEPIRIEVQ